MSLTTLPSSWPARAVLGWRMTRPAFLTITVAAVLLGVACAGLQGPIDLPLALATLLLACIAHAGANVLNDYHDARNGADAANTEGLYPFSGGSRLIQRGEVSERHTHLWALVLLGLLVPFGLLLVARSGPGLLLIGLVGLGLAWAYSAPPLQLMARGIGELAVALAWGLMVVGAAYVQQSSVVPAAAALGWGLALLVGCILLINGVPDARADASVAKRTLVVRLGPQRAARLYTVLVLLAHGGLVLAVWAALAPTAALWGLLSLPLSLAAAALLLRHASTPQRLRPAIGLTIAAANLHGLILAAALALSHR